MFIQVVTGKVISYLPSMSIVCYANLDFVTGKNSPFLLAEISPSVIASHTSKLFN